MLLAPVPDNIELIPGPHGTTPAGYAWRYKGTWAREETSMVQERGSGAHGNVSQDSEKCPAEHLSSADRQRSNRPKRLE